MHFQIVHEWKLTREIRKCFKLYVNENTSHEYLLNAANISRRRQWHPTPVLLPGKSHGQRNLVGCSLWSFEESDMTEWLHFHFSLSCIGEGNGNLPQCSCLENPRDGGTWWAAIYGVAQSRTRLKWLSSSSHSRRWIMINEREKVVALQIVFVFSKTCMSIFWCIYWHYIKYKEISIWWRLLGKYTCIILMLLKTPYW